MAFFCACQCSFFLTLLILIAASPIQTHARDSNFFSKVTRSEPQTLTPKTVEPKPETLNPEPEKVLPSGSPLPEAETKTEQGYGLFGKDEAYQYAPTTTNPTKSDRGNLKYVQPDGVKDGNRAYRYYAGEKQGMSDTRFLENGRYFHDINADKGNNGKVEEEEEEDGHESYYGQGDESGSLYRDSGYETYDKQGMSDTRSFNQYREPSRYETGEKQGMSDTRSFQNGYESGNQYREPSRYRTEEKQGNGEYFEDLEAEKRNNDRYSNNFEFYGSGKYGSEDGKYRNQFQRTGEKQGMSDTRYLENGRYFHDIHGESKEFVNEALPYQGESYDSNYEEEDEVSEPKQGNDFRGTPNKFPGYEFDSMEEYEKYVEGKSSQRKYVP